MQFKRWLWTFVSLFIVFSALSSGQAQSFRTFTEISGHDFGERISLHR